MQFSSKDDLARCKEIVRSILGEINENECETKAIEVMDTAYSIGCSYSATELRKVADALFSRHNPTSEK